MTEDEINKLSIILEVIGKKLIKVEKTIMEENHGNSCSET